MLKKEKVEELVLQSLEHEMGGVKIYELAVTLAQNADLKKEWSKYHEETKKHVSVLEKVCAALGVDPAKETPGRMIVRANGQALLEAMRLASASLGDPEAAQVVACECVVLAETKDHADWQLLGKCAEYLEGPAKEVLGNAYDEVEDDEDAHLYHTRGWCRELWLQSLGINAVLPPPEEVRKAKTAVSAAKAELSAEKFR